MRLARPNPQGRRARGEVVILFAAAGHTFAISATAVDEVCNTDGLRPAPARGRVHGLLERGCSTHYVVDAATHFQLPPAAPRHVLLLRDSEVALAIDAVERMTVVARLYALPRAFRGDECRWYRGLALIEGRVVPVVNPENILTRAELAAIEASGAVIA